jgi:hypothetical protein
MSEGTGQVPDIAAREALLIAKIQEKGGLAGNVTLQRELDWDDDLYWPILYSFSVNGTNGSAR